MVYVSVSETKRKTKHTFFPKESCILANRNVKSHDQFSLLFNTLPSVNHNVNQIMTLTSPIVPSSEIFSNQMQKVKLSKNGKDSSLHQTTRKLNFNSFQNNGKSRIMIAKCSNATKLVNIIQNNFKHSDLTVEKLNSPERSITFVIIGWFDLRDVGPQSEYLKNLLLKHLLIDVPIKPLSSNAPISVLTQIETSAKLKVLSDCFDTIYLYFRNCKLTEFNISFYQQETYTQLLKFGTVYKMNFLDQFNSFECKFYNIKTCFIIKKLEKISVNNCKAHICQTLVEVQEKMSNHPNNSLLHSGFMYHYKFSQEEWKKHHWLQYRRLGSLTFDNNIKTTRNENRIHIDKIITGEDTRVTLMIKNIPDRVKHNDLKEIIDESSFGNYNFLYLRIDFKNHSNVGYAFISFKEPLQIIKFYQARHQKEWPNLKSFKVCELAYATVQGLQNLVNRFKNSKVMNQSCTYRPRVYHTEGNKKGEEMDFPF
jgi:hypothetical protein